MKYSVATILCKGLAEWQIDLLTQQLADVGFDSFEQEGDTLRAYIPTEQLSTINSQLDNFSRLSSFNFQLTIDSCPDENWNAVWEASHEVEELPLGIRIVPHCAFGAGHHETTTMMIAELMNADLKGKRVFDHGTGTGVLAIFAAKRGAGYVLATDIDENSVRNAIDNAAANEVTISVQLNADVPEESFDLILANIHRNILLEHMSDYASCLQPQGELWLSGFYEADIPVLTEAAESKGLQHVATRTSGEWRMLIFRKSS